MGEGGGGGVKSEEVCRGSNEGFVGCGRGV